MDKNPNGIRIRNGVNWATAAAAAEADENDKKKNENENPKWK